jgi:IS4 transposase
MIYKLRWDIEVFFRFIKQELNFSHFLSTNINGIKMILYMTLILAMWILIYKKYNNVGYKTAKRRVKMELEELLTSIIVKVCGGNPDVVSR